ncbi:MAG: LPS export ABC transporter periplasmic protein LptC [Cellvibrio sp.]|nr:LPS export ABC transporter periplasmic protein LptC [Cellvibrio sp.]
MLKTFFRYIPLPWILVGLLSAIFFGFSFSANPQKNIEINEDTSQFPQFYMKDVTSREFEPNGKLRYQMSTPAITHYQLNLHTASLEDYTSIEHPQLTFYRDEQAPWNIQASEGRSERNGEQIQLLNRVVISQQSDTQGLIEIITESLMVKPEQQFVETDKAVKITAKQTQIDAVGLQADLSTSQLQLNSQVDAVYEPRR